MVILSGDHIYKMNYAKMVERHKAAGAACTISVMEVPWSEASRFGIMSVDENDLITKFAEKPKEPKSNLASMGIYVFSWKALREYLEEDEADPNSENDFGKNVIPAMLGNGEVMAAYRFLATGRMSVHWRAFGMPIWICCPRNPAWTCWTSPGPFTPGLSAPHRPSWAAHPM